MDEELNTALFEFVLELEESGANKEVLDRWIRDFPPLGEELIQLFVDMVRLEEIAAEDGSLREPSARWDQVKASGESKLRMLLHSRDRVVQPKRYDDGSL